MAVWQQIKKHLPVELVGLCTLGFFFFPSSSPYYPTVDYKSPSMEPLQKLYLNGGPLAVRRLALAHVHKSASNCPRP